MSCKPASTSTHDFQTTSSHAAAAVERSKNIWTAFDGVLHAVTMTCSVKVADLKKKKHKSVPQKEKSQWTQTWNSHETEFDHNVTVSAGPSTSTWYSMVGRRLDRDWIDYSENHVLLYFAMLFPGGEITLQIQHALDTSLHSCLPYIYWSSLCGLSTNPTVTSPFLWNKIKIAHFNLIVHSQQTTISLVNCRLRLSYNMILRISGSDQILKLYKLT